MEPEQSMPQPSPEQHPRYGKQVGFGVATIALIALIVVIFNHKQPADNAVSAVDVSTEPAPTIDQTPAVTTPIVPVAATTATTTTTAAKTTSSYKYKNGTYSATGSYQSPGGPDKLGVTLTLKDDVVTAVSVTPEPGDRESKYYQGIFVSNYKPLVIGKDISTLKLSKVSGSSLTPIGFNNALAQIKEQAQA